MTHIISYKEFKSVDIRVGTIISAEENLKLNNPSIILKIDFGKKIGIKSTSAQITNYSVDQLIGRQIVGICNLPSKNIAGFVSEVLVLGAVLEEEVHLLRTDDKLENGTLIG